MTMVGIAAFAIRMLNVFVWRPTTQGCALVFDAGRVVGDGGCYSAGGDALYHLVQGEAIARGDWYLSSVHYYFFGEVMPGAGDPPLYAAFLGMVSALGGTGGSGARAAALLLLVAILGLSIWVTHRRLGSHAARLAALISTSVGALFAFLCVVPAHRVESQLVSQSVLPQLEGRAVAGPGFMLLDGTSHRAASGMVGVAGVMLIAVLAGRLAGERAGLVAGVIAAAYPMLWINDGMILSESLYVPVLSAAILAGLHLWRDPVPWRAAVFGAACAAASLTRAEAALLPLMVAPAIAIGARHLAATRRLVLVVATGAAALGTVGPWLLWNLSRFEEPALMTSQTWAVFSASSCDTAFGLSQEGRFLGYYANCFDELVSAGMAEWPPLDLDESQRDVLTRDATLEYIKQHRSRLPVVMAARIGRMWDLFKPGQNTYLNWTIEGRGRTASWVGLAMYYPLLALALGGVVVMRRRRLPISPFVGMAVVVTVTAAITFGTTRYRVPVEVSIVVLAAVFIDHMLGKVRLPNQETG